MTSKPLFTVKGDQTQEVPVTWELVWKTVFCWVFRKPLILQNTNAEVQVYGKEN